MKIGKLFVLSGFLGLYLAPAVALSEGVHTGGDSLSEKARLKQYPGGIDDGDIQVQEDLPAVLQKVSKKEIEKKVYKNLLNKEEKTSE